MKFVALFFIIYFSVSSMASYSVNWVSGRDLRITKQIGICSGNSANQVGTFDYDDFNYKEATEVIRSSDKERGYSSRTCAQGRFYSQTSKVGVQSFLDYVQQKGDDVALDYQNYTKECFDDNFKRNELKEAIKLISDPKNIAVISSLFQFEDEFNEHGESCGYYEWYIYRADGTLLKWAFDQSL